MEFTSSSVAPIEIENALWEPKQYLHLFKYEVNAAIISRSFGVKTDGSRKNSSAKVNEAIYFLGFSIKTSTMPFALFKLEKYDISAPLLVIYHITVYK